MTRLIERVIDREVKATQDLRDAEKRKDEHHEKVVRPGIYKFVNELLPIVGDETIKFSATLDGRFYKLDTKYPHPEIATRQYKVERSGPYEHLKGTTTDGYSLTVHYWDQRGAWNGPYSPGKPGWTGVNAYHEYLVLEHLAQSEEKRNPYRPKDALLVLLDKFAELAEKKKLTEEELTALNVLQAQHRDQALMRDVR